VLGGGRIERPAVVRGPGSETPGLVRVGSGVGSAA